MRSSLRALPLFLLLLASPGLLLAQTGTLRGYVTGPGLEPAPDVHILVEGTSRAAVTDASGAYAITGIPVGAHVLRVTGVQFRPVRRSMTIVEGVQTLDLELEEATYTLGELVVSDRPASHNERTYFTLSRLPVAARDQPQTISVVDERLLRQQEALTVRDAIKNIPGAYAWATFGGVNNTFGARGYRGITYLKNGVRVSTSVPAIEGAESVQVIKGASAILFGSVSPGGVINLETKQPRFTSGTRVGVQAGSFGLIRSSFDTWGPLDEQSPLAYRLNGVYLSSDSYRKGVSQEKVYLNPSLAWRLGDATMLTFEYDYLLDNSTPDNGTILLNNEIYDLPFDRFTGFSSDNLRTEAQSLSTTLMHRLGPAFSLRGTFQYVRESSNQQRPAANSNVIAGTSLLRRVLTRSENAYAHAAFQVDLLGRQVRTGFVTHDLQVGFDYQQHKGTQLSFASAVIDTVDVVAGLIPHTVALPPLARDFERETTDGTLGFTAQDVLTFADRLKLILGLRYSTLQSEGARYDFTGGTTQITPFDRSHGWSPSIGMLYRVNRNVGLFATYTNTFEPVAFVGKNGEDLGDQVTDQVEVGARTEWFGNRLTANLTLYRIFDDNQIVEAWAQDASGVWKGQGYYERSGSLRNQGVEVDVRALLPGGVEVTTGYSFIDAHYLKSDRLVDGAEPFNTPRHSANLWAYYEVPSGTLKRVSLGAGAFFTGARWGNDQVKRPWHGIDPNVPVHRLPGYTEVNLALGYRVKRVGLRLGVDNLLDERSYLSYRGNYINPIEPRRYSLSLSYSL